jgi:hypothetical protein
VGDEDKVISRDGGEVRVREITRLYIARRYGAKDLGVLKRIMEIESVPEDWKGYFGKRIGG